MLLAFDVYSDTLNAFRSFLHVQRIQFSANVFCIEYAFKCVAKWTHGSTV